MPSLPGVTGEKLVGALRKAGFEKLRQRGSHVTMVRRQTGSVVVVPVHKGKDLPIGTLHAIVGAAGISPEELVKLL